MRCKNINITYLAIYMQLTYKISTHSNKYCNKNYHHKRNICKTIMLIIYFSVSLQIINSNNMKRCIYYLISLCFLLSTSCCQHQNQTLQEKLTNIDSLLENEYTDSATSMIKQLNISSIKDSCILAYYNLITTRLDYMQYKSNISLLPINQSIDIYTRLNDEEKLARCYYYKAAILYTLGKRKEAIEIGKRAEASTLNNPLLKGKIYNFLSLVNSENNNYELAMNYARKYFHYIQSSSNNSDKIDSYNRMAISHYYLSQIDSAIFYINKCIPLLKYATDSAKIIYLDNIGFLNMHSNPRLALKYLNLAMQLGPSIDTYDNLAQIYVKQGEKEKADSLWKKALQTKDLVKKTEIIAAILRQKQKERDYKKVAHFASWLVELKDSLDKQRKDEQILVKQIKFDNDLTQAEQQKKIIRLTYAIAFIVLVFVIICLLAKYQNMKRISERLEHEKKINDFQKAIDKMTATGNTKEQKIKDLQKRIDKLQKHKDAYSLQGHLFYETAISGMSIKNWNKPELMTFLDYYVSKDIEYSLSLEEIEQLTAREKVFLILLHEGKTEAKVAEMMALSNSALRTMKSRIKKKRESE